MRHRFSLLVQVVAIMIFTEATINAFFRLFRPVAPGLAGDLLDAFLLAAVTGPICYFWIFRERGGKENWRHAHDESEARFRLLVESAPDAIFVQVEGCFAYLNAAAAQLFGAPDAASLIGGFVLERFHPDCRAMVQERIRLVNEQRQAVRLVELGCLRLDGTTVAAEVRSVPIEFLGKPGALVFARDVSQRKEAQALLQSIVDGTPDVIYAVDRHGRSLLSNAAALRVTGARSHGGKTAEELFPREEAEQIKAEERRLLDSGATETREETVTSSDGTRRTFSMTRGPIRDSAGAIVGLFGVGRDISETKKAEEVLQNYAAIVSQSSDAFLSTDTDGLLTSWSPGAQSLFGYSAPEILGKPITVLAPERRDGEVLTNLDRIRKGETFQYESPRRAKDGSLVHVWATLSPIRDSAGRVIGVSAIYRDMTRLKQSQEKLLKSEERYRSLVDNVGIGVALISPELEILSLNRQMQEWFPRIDLGAKPICYRSYHTPPRDAPCPYCPTVLTLRDGQVHEAVSETLTPDGVRHYRIVSSPIKDAEGRITAAIEMVEDITAARRAEAALRESKSQFQALYDNAVAGIYIIEAGRFQYINPAFANIFGYTQAEILALDSFLDLVMEEDRELVADQIRRRESGEAKKAGYTFTGRRRDGTPVSIEIMGSAIEQGGRRLAIGTLSDISDRKLAQERLEAAFGQNEAILNSISDGFISLDRDWRYTRVNPAAARMSRKAAEELLGRSIWEVWPDLDQTPFGSAYRRSVATKVTVSLEAFFEPLNAWFEVRCYPSSDGLSIFFGDATERKRSEEALRESEERFRQLVETAPESIHVQIEGRFAYVNPTAIRLFGASRPEDLLGTSVLERIHPDYRTEVHERIRLIDEERRPVTPAERRYLRLDGSEVGVEVSAAPCRFQGRDGSLVYVRDISARKKSEAAVRAAGDFRDAIVNAVGDPIFVKDSEHRWQLFNEAFCRLTGFPREGLLGKSDYDFFPKEQADVFWAKDEQVLATGVEDLNEEALTDASGQTRFLSTRKTLYTDPSGRKFIVGLIHDITRRKHDEGRLEQNYLFQRALNEMLKASLTSAPLPQKLENMLGLLLKTPLFMAQGKGCVFIQDGGALVMTAQVGLSEPARVNCGRLALGRCICGRVAQSGQEILISDIDERHDVSHPGMQPHGHFCLPLRSAGESLGILNLYLVRGQSLDEQQQDFVRAGAGILAGAVLLARAEEKLLQAQKMEAVGRLAGGVAHDFNNILTAIKGYSEFLMAALPPADPRHADAEEIRKSADRAAALTRQLLAFSRRQVLAPQVLDLNDVVSGMAKMLHRLLGDDVKLETRLAPELSAVLVDPGQMEQVIMNLAVNARDAMPRGGDVVIETKAVCRQPPAGRTAAQAKDSAWVMLSVSDTGAGMDAQVRSHIFEPFYTTKPKGKGTGLGLSTVYGIVKQSAGDIEVESAPGRGSVFRVFLPASRQTEPQAPAAAGPGGAVPTGMETVLLAEDEAPVRALARRALSEAGYRVLAAANGQEALALLERHEGALDLLLTDVVMPGQSGPDLAAAVRKARPGTRVLYMSGNEDGILAKQGVLKPGVALFTKPFSPAALTRKVREVLDLPPTAEPS